MSQQEMLVEQHHKLQYSSNTLMVAQQTRSRLMGSVTEIPASGEAQSVADLIGTMEYAYGEERSRRNPETDVQKSRRWVVMPPPIEVGNYITKEEKFRTATDPTSSYVRGQVLAVTRGWDDRLLGVRKTGEGEFTVTDGGILGIAREGKTPGTGMPLPASQYIPHGNTGLTLNKLRAARKRLKKAEFGIEEDDQLFCIISPDQEDDLIGIAAEAGPSLNAFNIEHLREGKATRLMGIEWIMTNRLPQNTAKTARLNPIFSKRNIIAGAWQGIQGAMWNDTHATNLPYAYTSAYVDVVRAQDKGVIVIESAEAA